MVKIQEENKEQVQYKCWAGWASEEKMRDTLKIKELASYIFVYLSRKQLNMFINSGVIGLWIIPTQDQDHCNQAILCPKGRFCEVPDPLLIFEVLQWPTSKYTISEWFNGLISTMFSFMTV